MSTKMRRRRAQARLKLREVRRREDGLFFAHGTIPRSARAVAVCGCGGRAFTRGASADNVEFMRDFDERHADCEGSW